MTPGQRFARLVTRLVVRAPALWVLFRGPLRRMFDRLAPCWHARQGGPKPHLDAALDALGVPPRRVLDLGTGTGAAAVVLARRFPEAEIVGVDVSPAMIAEAERVLPDELRGRIRFEVGDAARLRYEDGAFDLVVLANMIPFFAELERIVAPGGHALVGFSGGAGTPIYVPPDRLRAGLAAAGFTDFADFAAGRGASLLARRRDRT